MMHTSNVTFNSFAAEVLFHADKLESWWNSIPFAEVYEMAVRADMAIGEDKESGYSEIYYNLNSSIVQEQIQYHDEC